MIRYDPHAEFQIARRDIPKTWVEQTLREPDVVEQKGSRRSFFKSHPEYIITAYFDRKKPCASG